MKNQIVILGTGKYGEEAYELLHNEHTIQCFADNNPKKISTTFHGIEVVALSALPLKQKEGADILVAIHAHRDVGGQLDEMGIRNYYVYQNGVIYRNHIRGSQIKRCNRCVMDDSSDEYILFDENGFCNYCNGAMKLKSHIYYPDDEGKRQLDLKLEEIKKYGRGKKYDCIMGLSGGLDSSYLAYLGYKWGVRVLAVHIDDGYDTEVSKSNLAKIIKRTGFDYRVICPDDEQYNALTLAYMKAGVPNIAVPQDNILFAYLYKLIRENHLKYFLSGGNFALESILQMGNTHNAFDIRNLFHIHKMFGNKPIDKLEFISSEQRKRDAEEFGIESPRLLNYVEYNRNKALEELREFCGFEYYGRKHLENILTAFIQLYWFPIKFGVDKRTSHLSSMIMSGQMTREEAMQLLEEPLYDANQMKEYIGIIKERMKIDDHEFERIMNDTVHKHEDYDHEFSF